tara:strand:+ start:758 stop:940 length:183 start_codon:yes stop_codon:yes gene_type:complete
MIATIALIFSVVLVIALVVLAIMHKNNLDEDKNFVPDSVDNKARSIKDKFKAIIRIVKKK